MGGGADPEYNSAPGQKININIVTGFFENMFFNTNAHRLFLFQAYYYIIKQGDESTQLRAMPSENKCLYLVHLFFKFVVVIYLYLSY